MIGMWQRDGVRFRYRRKSLDISILREVFRDGNYEVCTFRKGDRWLDIGAHIGAFSVLAAPKVESVRAYEADARNYGFLVDNLALNECWNVEAHLEAVAGSNGTRVLWKHPKRNTAAHSLIMQDGFKPSRIAALDINDILGDATCVKMDVEGAEWEIVRAVEDWGGVRQIIVEFHHQLLRAVYVDFVALLSKTFHLTRSPINKKIQCESILGVR